ncbi:hypothetical protein KAW18_03665 [candidate division WOR-3 bacterium]|nr:hypothetical protein [candidate division WOR-3 bacterium]
MNIIDLYLAKKKLRTKNIGSSSIFLSTVWKGEIVMCVFDTLTNKVMSLNCFRELDFEEIKQLEDVLVECLS